MQLKLKNHCSGVKKHTVFLYLYKKKNGKTVKLGVEGHGHVEGQFGPSPESYGHCSPCPEPPEIALCCLPRWRVEGLSSGRLCLTRLTFPV